MDKDLVEQCLRAEFGDEPQYLSEGSFGQCWNVAGDTVKIFLPKNVDRRDIEMTALHSLLGIEFQTASVPKLYGHGLMDVDGEPMPYLRYGYLEGQAIGDDNIGGVSQSDVAQFLATLHAQAPLTERPAIPLVDTLPRIMQRLEGSEWPKAFEEFALREATKLSQFVDSKPLGSVVRSHNDVTPDNILGVQANFSDAARDADSEAAQSGWDNLSVIDFGNMIDAAHEYEFRHMWRFDPQWSAGVIDEYDKISGKTTDHNVVAALSMLRTIYLVSIMGSNNNWSRALPFSKYLPQQIAEDYAAACPAPHQP
jgi:hypothetical protein